MNEKKFKSMTKRELLTYINEVVIAFLQMRVLLVKVLNDSTVTDSIKQGVNASIYYVSDCIISVLSDMDKKDLIEERIKKILPELVAEKEHIDNMMKKKKSNP